MAKEVTGFELLDIIDDNTDWLESAEDPAAMLAALVQTAEQEYAEQPVAA